jgi:hypothetical protein
MSGKPSPDGVSELRRLAFNYRIYSDRAAALAQSIQQQKRELADVAEARNGAHDLLIEKLQEMDCASQGNFGWKERVAWMLGEFAAQVAQATEKQSNATDVADVL